MEKFATIVWWVLRAIILLGLLGLTVGTGICGILLFSLDNSSGPPDTMTIVVVIGLVLLTCLFGWIAWVVGRALFRRRPPDAPP